MWQFFENGLGEQVVRALCWTFIHSLWQGLLAALLAALIIAGTRKSTALLRYNLLTGVLFLFVTGAVATFALQWGTPTETPTLSGTVTGQTETVFSQAAATVTTAAEQTPWQLFRAYFDQQAPLIVLLWGLCFLYHFVRLLAGVHYIHRLRTTGLQEATQEWKQRLLELRQYLRIQQGIQLFESRLVKVPAVVGLFKPVILVPVGLLAQLPPAYVETILIHELAHIRRKDFGVNLLQSVVEMIFFFNPALLWISSLMRQEREACCDDIVLAHTGDKKNYLEALVSFQETAASPSAYVMALRHQKSFLLNRVRRMLTQENKRLSIMEKVILFTALFGASAFAFIPKPQEDTLVPPPAKPVAAAAPIPTAAPVVVALKPTAASAAPTHAKPVTSPAPVAKPVKSQTVTPAPAPPVPVLQDTVPQKSKEEEAFKAKYPIKSVNTNVNDNDGKKNHQSTVTTSDGKTYYIQKINGETTLMTVNGLAVPKEQWGQYQDLWDGIERRQKESAARRAEQQKRREQEQQRRKEEMVARQAEQRADQQEHNRKIQQENQRRKQEQQRIEQSRVNTATAQNTRSAQASARAATRVGQRTNGEIDLIVSELLNQKIITSREQVAFTLTNDQLVVNGKKQDAEVQQRLKERIKLGSGDSYQYKREGNSTTTTIVRN
jgi:bla regulator protein blaR1